MNNFDLEERTARFAEDVIELCKSIEITPLSAGIIINIFQIYPHKQ